jgi:tetratricopeptide (TPR) repeat protein
MRIPWIVQPYPVLSETKSLSTPASVVDVLPTIQGLLGLPISESIDGIDAISTQRTDPVYMESNTVQQRFGYHPEIGLSDGIHKLMPTISPHLYDLNGDPNETINIWSEAISSAWDEWYTQGRTLYTSEPKFSLEAPDASVMKQLEALGYMGGTNGSSNDLSEFTIDAKDRLKTISELNDIVSSKRRVPPATPDEIIIRFETLLKTEPQLAEARLLLGQTYSVVGRKEDAIRTFEEALSLNPSSVVVALNLANQLAELKRFDEGIAILEGILERVPSDKSAQSNLLRMISDTGNHTGAIDKGSVWLEQNPSTQLQAIMGVILVRNKQFDLGKEMLEASLSDDIPREHVHRSLGHIALVENKVETAIVEYQKELKKFEDPKLRMTLAKLYEQLKDWTNAAKEHCNLRQLTPNVAHVHLNCAQSLFNLGQYEEAATALKPAQQMRPDGPFVLLLSANITSKQGDEVEAKRLFEAAQEARKKQIERGHQAQPQK